MNSPAFEILTPLNWSSVNTNLFNSGLKCNTGVSQNTNNQDLTYSDKRASYLSCLIKGGSLLPWCHASRQWEDYRAWSDHQLSDERHPWSKLWLPGGKIAHADSKHILPHINTWPWRNLLIHYHTHISSRSGTVTHRCILVHQVRSMTFLYGLLVLLTSLLLFLYLQDKTLTSVSTLRKRSILQVLFIK